MWGAYKIDVFLQSVIYVDDDPQILGLAFWLTTVSLYVHKIAVKPKYTTTHF